MGLFFKKKVKTPIITPEERIIRRQEYLKKQYNIFNDELSNIPHIEFQTDGVKTPKRLLRDMPVISFYNITKRTNIDSLSPLVVLDVETTGLRAAQCDIIEFSAIKYETNLNEPTSCLTTLLKSKKPLPDDITKITNITDEMIGNSPYFYQIKNSVNEYIKDCTIVGHNLLFDLKFLYVNDIILSDKVKYIDTLELAKTILKNPYKSNYDYDVDDYRLTTLCEYYNIYRDNAHRSLSDCLATAKLLNELIEEKIF